MWELEEHHLGTATFTHWPDGTAHKNRMQGNDYVQSQMYVKGVQCSACHDVHGTEHEADLRLPGNAVCLQCHNPVLQPGPRGAIEFHTQHAANSEGSKCVACHMPAIAADHCERQRPQPHVQVHFAGHVGALRRAESLHVVSQGQVQRMGDRRAADLAERAPVAGRPVTNMGREAYEHLIHRMRRAAAAAVVFVLFGSGPLLAQQEERCRILCAPALKIEPTFTVENLFRAPLVETIEDGVVVESGREKRETVFELIFALDVPTAIPRLGLTLEAIFKPFGSTDVNPFTGASAHAIGRSDIRDNGIEIEAELNIHLLTGEETGGWVSSHVDVVDQFSPAASANGRQRVHAQAGLRVGHGVPSLQPAAGRALASRRGSRGLARLSGDRAAESRRRAWKRAIRAAREPVVAVVRAGDAAGAVRAMMSREAAPSHAVYGPKT